MRFSLAAMIPPRMAVATWGRHGASVRRDEFSAARRSTTGGRASCEVGGRRSRQPLGASVPGCMFVPQARAGSGERCRSLFWSSVNGRQNCFPTGPPWRTWSQDRCVRWCRPPRHSKRSGWSDLQNLPVPSRLVREEGSSKFMTSSVYCSSVSMAPVFSQVSKPSL